MTFNDIPVDVAKALLRQMVGLSRVEEVLHEEYHPADEMRCPIHFCVGQAEIPAAMSLCVSGLRYG